MAYKLMIQGTMSGAGKSFLVTGLCRYFRRQGYRTAPFKSQNMALNSYVTEEGLEVGRAQAVQAQAAGAPLSVYMNPVLLKPTSDVGSQVIVLGKPVGNMRAAEYHEYKTRLKGTVRQAFKKLEEDYDVIIIEGAGSPAEINLRDNDIVNMGLADMLDAPVLLVGDIDPGGVFAQLYGTLMLLENEERARVRGLLINKFRGDPKLLESGLCMLEQRCGVPVLGVVPMSGARIEEEDSQGSCFGSSCRGRASCDIAVIHLPRISNFTDFDVFVNMEGVRLRYVSSPSEFGNPDIVIIPGTKNTIADLEWLKSTGLFGEITAFSREKPVMGICGGFQMLGRLVADPLDIEGGGDCEGLGLLDVGTELLPDKTTVRCEGTFPETEGFFGCLSRLSYKGYEIHAGDTLTPERESVKILASAAGGGVLGTYAHGCFDAEGIAETLVRALVLKHDDIYTLPKATSYEAYRDSQYDMIADLLEKSLDMNKIKKIMGIKT